MRTQATTVDAAGAVRPVGDTPVFVHDFAPLDVAFADAFIALTELLDHRTLAGIVATSWNSEVASDHLLHVDHHPCASADIDIRLGHYRERGDAVIVPLAWESVAEWVSPLDADIELAAFGRWRSHLHIVGRSRLAPGTRTQTARAITEQRLAAAVVRRVINAIADRLVLQVGRTPNDALFPLV
mgnify:CR=1 FL=1